jgi:hypothetical protein
MEDHDEAAHPPEPEHVTHDPVLDATAGSVCRALSPKQWQRGGIHPMRGRMTVDDFVAVIAWHDDKPTWTSCARSGGEGLNSVRFP